jgi:hypothetical protein
LASELQLKLFLYENRYHEAYGKLDLEEKKQELFDSQSRFLLARRDDGEEYLGYAMWRFDWEQTMEFGEDGEDIDVPTVYWSVISFCSAPSLHCQAEFHIVFLRAATNCKSSRK